MDARSKHGFSAGEHKANMGCILQNSKSGHSDGHHVTKALQLTDNKQLRSYQGRIPVSPPQDALRRSRKSNRPLKAQ
jgi:hypothetical protein